MSNQGVSSGTVFSLDNRRLYIEKQAGVKVNFISATQEEHCFERMQQRGMTQEMVDKIVANGKVL